jgi:hypothetical protein
MEISSKKMLLIAPAVASLLLMLYLPNYQIGSAVNITKNNITNTASINSGDIKDSSLPGRNMTFGSSLDSAKMHLMEALMDLKSGDNQGAIMQLNMTNIAIAMHEQEMNYMMQIMRSKSIK